MAPRSRSATPGLPGSRRAEPNAAPRGRRRRRSPDPWRNGPRRRRRSRAGGPGHGGPRRCPGADRIPTWSVQPEPADETEREALIAALDRASGRRGGRGFRRRECLVAVRVRRPTPQRACGAATRDPRVVEPRHPGQDDRHEQAPPGDRGCPTRPRRRTRRARPRPPATTSLACRGRVPETTPRSTAASRSPETRNSRATIAATIHPAKTALADEDDQVASTSTLSATGSSSDPRGRPSLAAGDPPVDPVGRHRRDEQRRGPVVVAGKSQT